MEMIGLLYPEKQNKTKQNKTKQNKTKQGAFFEREAKYLPHLIR
jgi:hypothetical protein